jgi:hypothetical protein
VPLLGHLWLTAGPPCRAWPCHDRRTASVALPEAARCSVNSSVRPAAVAARRAASRCRTASR